MGAKELIMEEQCRELRKHNDGLRKRVIDLQHQLQSVLRDNEDLIEEAQDLEERLEDRYSSGSRGLFDLFGDEDEYEEFSNACDRHGVGLNPLIFSFVEKDKQIELLIKRVDKLESKLVEEGDASERKTKLLVEFEGKLKALRLAEVVDDEATIRSMIREINITEEGVQV